MSDLAELPLAVAACLMMPLVVLGISALIAVLAQGLWELLVGHMRGKVVRGRIVARKRVLSNVSMGRTILCRDLLRVVYQYNGEHHEIQIYDANRDYQDCTPELVVPHKNPADASLRPSRVGVFVIAALFVVMVVVGAQMFAFLPEMF